MLASLSLSVALVLGSSIVILGGVLGPSTKCDSEKLESLQSKCAWTGKTSNCTEDDRAELDAQLNACSELEGWPMTRGAVSCIQPGDTDCQLNPNKNTPKGKQCCPSAKRGYTTKCSPDEEEGEPYCTCSDWRNDVGSRFCKAST